MSKRSTSISSMVNNVAIKSNPLSCLKIFLEEEEKSEKARQVDKMRFVGYVLELGYDTAKIITSDPYKLAVGGIPRGSFLIMTPSNFGDVPLHFTLLRVTGVSPTPLTNQVQQTYFELHKKSMPELDVWTQSELQWGALDCDVLGMFYPNPQHTNMLSFSGDVNNVVSAHRYKVFAPNEALLNLIVNGTVKPELKFEIGTLRTRECQLILKGTQTSNIPVTISMKDFKGCRTAMFGKTRLGKSNVVKLIAQGMLELTKDMSNVGQLIFDINGEYANDNPQDGNKSIRSAYEKHCEVFALTKRVNTPSEDLRFNFYEQPESCIEVIASMLEEDNKSSIYIKSFASVILPSIESTHGMTDEGDKTRAIRKIQMFWAILREAGFLADEQRLKNLKIICKNAKHFNPGFSKKLRDAAWKDTDKTVPPNSPESLHELVDELKTIWNYARNHEGEKILKSSSGKPIFDTDDKALLKFLTPLSGSGPSILNPYRKYHSPNANDIIKKVLQLLDSGKTVILDLGNAADKIRRYFSDVLSKAVFRHQEKKFVDNELKDDYIQLYFEEAHNLFPINDKDLTGVYARFAKEGAKFHIGMVYSTQSPSTINKELLAQTENFFVGHLSSQEESKALSRLQIAFQGIEDDILKAKTPGYMRMLTMSHRFVIPLQTKLFEAIALDQKDS